MHNGYTVLSVHFMKAYRGRKGTAPLSLTLITRFRLSDSIRPQQLYSLGEVPGTHCIGGWVGSRTGLEVLEKRKSLAICHNWNEIIITSKCWRTTALLVWWILLRPNQWTERRVQASCMIMVRRFSTECVWKAWCGIQETQILSKYFITSD